MQMIDEVKVHYRFVGEGIEKQVVDDEAEADRLRAELRRLTEEI